MMPRSAVESYVSAIERGEVNTPEGVLVLSCDPRTRRPIDQISRAGAGFLLETRIGGCVLATVIYASGQSGGR